MEQQLDTGRTSESRSKHPVTIPIIKTETNLAGLPFFALSRQEVRSRSKTEYGIAIERDGKKLQVLWRVTANTEHGYPGPFDRKVHKAIEYIINQQRIPIENPVPFSIYELCKLMEIANSGTNKNRIMNAVRRIVATTVDSEGIFYSKKEKRYITDTFHIYDRVILRGRHLPNGETADTNYLFLSQWYLDSINAFYVRPIDFDYFRQLRSDIAGRLYELLSLKFYGAISNRRAYWRVEYRELCNLLPITVQKYPSNAKRYLDPAHQELMETEFLSTVVWDTEGVGSWYILYYPGKRARDEIKPGPTQEQLRLEGSEDGREEEHNAVQPQKPAEKEELLSALRERGVGKKQAQHLVEEHAEWVKWGIELWEAERKQSPDAMTNPAGYLVSIIEAGEEWQPPQGYASGEERERRKRQKRNPELLEQLQQATGDEAASPVLPGNSKEDRSNQELERDIGRIREEKRKSEDRKAIEEALSDMTPKELKGLREQVLAEADDFHKSRPSYKQICQRDIRDWGDEDLTEMYLRGIRDQIIRGRLLKGEV